MTQQTYTPQQMALSARFAAADAKIPVENRAIYEMMMSSVLFGMELAEKLNARRQSTARQDSA